MTSHLESPATDHRLCFGLPAVSRFVESEPDEIVWVEEDWAATWADLNEELRGSRVVLREAGVRAHDVVAIEARPSLPTMARFLALAEVRAVILPLRPSRFAEIERWTPFVAVDWRWADTLTQDRTGTSTETSRRLIGELSRRQHPGLILATGGTTGTPKLVVQDLVALWEAIPLKEAHRARILPLMHWDHIGGLDMWWRALGSRQAVVHPPPSHVVEAVAERVERFRVEVLPATPSFLNLLFLAHADRPRDFSSLRVVPYGAEPMPAPLLRRLQARWPHIRFVERYGMSETGVLPFRADGSGQPLRTLHSGLQFKVVEDELWIRTPTVALGYLTGEAVPIDREGWFRTGDLVSVDADGGIRVLGRRQEMINVGGEKILPVQIESVLQEHPDVVDCRAFAAANGILGQVVAVEVVWRGSEKTPLEVKRALHRFAHGRLTSAQLPVSVHLVPSVAATGNHKKSRGGAA